MADDFTLSQEQARVVAAHTSLTTTQVLQTFPNEFPFEGVTECKARMEGEVEDAGAFCAEWVREAKGEEPAAMCLHQVSLQDGPDQIERVEQDDGTVRWKGLMLLAPGVWQDGLSGESIFYSERGIRASVDRWADDTVNLFHEFEDDTWQVGEVDTSTATVDDQGRLFADVVLSMESSASQLTDEALQKAFETNGQEGIEGPSVELAPDQVEFNRDRGVREMLQGTLHGLAFVGVGLSPGPASKTANFEHQARERAVAMHSLDEGRVKVLSLKEDVNASTGVPGLNLDLDDVDPDDVSLEDHVAALAAKKLGKDPSEVMETLTRLQEDDENEEDEPGVMELLRDEVQARVTEDVSEEEATEQVISAIAEATERDEDEVRDLLDDGTVPEDVEAAVRSLITDDDEDDEDEEANLQDVLDQVGSLEESVDERLTALEESVDGVDVDDLETRLSKLEDEPMPTRSLHDNGDDEGEDEVNLEDVSFLAGNGPRQPTRVKR